MEQIIPVVTYAGPLLATLLTGSFVVESMFTIPGIGSEFVSSVSGRDYTLIMALTVLYGSLVIIANILTDIISAIRYPADSKKITFDLLNFDDLLTK